MDADLKSLEQKLGQFVELCERLRADNQQLRQQLASANEKIGSAASRLESLLQQIPEEDA